MENTASTIEITGQHDDSGTAYFDSDILQCWETGLTLKDTPVMKQYKVKMTKHTKFEDLIIGAKSEQDALKKAGEVIKVATPIDTESVTIVAEEENKEVDKKGDSFNIPPDRRTKEGTVVEGLQCQSCRKIYTNPEDIECLIHGTECMSCSKLRTELEEQRRDDYEEIHGKDID